MPEVIMIYLLSISENISTTFWWLGAGSLVVFALIHILYGIKYSSESGNTPLSKLDEVDAAYNDTCSRINKHFKTTLICSVVFWFIAALFPSTKAVLTAYALVEGSKVINADNAEMAADAVGKRFDKFLDIVDKGINGREEVVAPAVQAPK